MQTTILPIGVWVGGTAGQPLVSGGVGSPSWSSALGLSFGGSAADLSGVAQGGLVYKGASALAGTAALSGLIQGNGATAPTAITGTTGYVPLWAGAAPYLTATSPIYSDGANLGFGTTSFIGRYTFTRTAGTEGLVVNGTLTGTDLFAHAFADNTIVSSANTGAYASIDAIPTLTGTIAYNHFCGFQSRITYSGSGLLDTMASHTSYPIVNGPVTNLFHVNIYDPLGAGAIALHAGIYIHNLTRGTTNYAIYSSGSMPSYHGGTFSVGGDCVVTGTITGSNFKYAAAFHSLAIGPSGVANVYNTFVGVATGASTGAYNTYLGADSGGNRTGATSSAVLLGSFAGFSYSGANSSNIIFIGDRCGYYETGSNTLMIDAIARSSEVDARAKAILYGTFAETVAGQSLTINADLKHSGAKAGFYGITPTTRQVLATGAGKVVDDVITTLQTLGLVAQS